MPFVKHLRLPFALILCLTLLWFASADVEVLQTIEGRLLVSGQPAAGTIKVLAWKGRDCGAAGVTTPLASDGRFKLTRTVHRGRMAVVVQNDLVCVMSADGKSEVVWNSQPYGPAANHLSIECDRLDSGWRCSVLTDWGTDLAD